MAHLKDNSRKLVGGFNDFLSSEFGCEESGGVTYFHGLVVNSRTIYRYKKLILMSIGVGNDKYVDLIIDKKIFKGGKQWIYVTGCGLTKKQFNSEFIEVIIYCL